jgi:hypothetical protein
MDSSFMHHQVKVYLLQVYQIAIIGQGIEEQREY